MRGPALARTLMATSLLLVGSALADELQPLPPTPLDALPEEARDQVTEQRQEVETLLAAADQDDVVLAEAFGELGKLYYLYGFSGVTQISWENASALAPDDYRWHYYLGMLLRIEGEMDAAENRLLRVLELRPQDRATWILLGQVDLDRGDLAGAAERFDTVLAVDPESSAALYGLGQIALAEKRYEDAVSLLERALVRQPEGSAMNHQLGLAYRGLGDMEKAAEYMRRNRSVDIRSHDPLMRELVPMVRGAHFRARLGVEALKAGDTAEAIARLEEAKELDPDSARVHYNLAVAYRQAGRRDDARRELVACLDLDPDYSRAHFNLGSLLADAGDYEGALRHFSSAWTIDPQDHSAHLEMAVALSRLGRQEAAVEELRSLVDEAPQFADAKLALATLLAQLGRQRESMAVVEEMMQLDATDVELSAASVMAARLALPADPAAAEAHYQRAIDLDPTSEEALHGLALLLGRQGRFVESAGEFERLVVVNPERPDYRVGLSIALLLGESYSRAVDVLEEARLRFPESVEFVHSLARLLATCPDESVRDGARAVELARRAFEGQRTIDHAETLAMALAESGRYEEAVVLQSQVMAQRERMQGGGMALQHSSRYLDLYRRGVPVRAPWLDGS